MLDLTITRTALRGFRSISQNQHLARMKPQHTSTMSSKTPNIEFPIHSFADAAELETFYEKHHATLPGIHLKFAKKSSGFPSVTGAEAVEAALCYGWIDGRANGLNDTHWLVRYTPRRAKQSIWSRKNVETVTRLTAEGRMRPAGLAAVEAAKADGRWERAYAGPATMVPADDFLRVLRASDAAQVFYESLNRSERYAVLWRVETASASARAGRIEALVQMLADGQKPGEQQQVKQQQVKDSEEAKEKVISRRKSSSDGRAARVQVQKAMTATTKREAGTASSSSPPVKRLKVESTAEPVLPRRQGLRSRK